MDCLSTLGAIELTKVVAAHRVLADVEGGLQRRRYGAHPMIDLRASTLSTIAGAISK